MKAEDTPTTTTTSTPTVQYATTQWGNNQIPIDPALQQASQPTPTTTPYQHYQAYSHYPTAAYGAYSQYQQAQMATVQPVTAQRPATTTTTTTAPATQSNDSGDVFNDALGSAGVDLRAEEETLQRTHDAHQAYRPYEDRTRKQAITPSFDTRFLAPKMRTVSAQHKVKTIPDDSINYLALALRARLEDLIKDMIAAAHHRTDAQFDRPVSLYDDGTPMWGLVVRSDVAKQVAALEKVEREEESKIRKERKERLDMAEAQAQALAAQAAGNGLGGMEVDEDGAPKKKKKKDGPGVTAKNMSGDMQKKMSNAAASHAAGLGGKYAWMSAAATSATPAPKPKPAVTTTSTAASPLATPTISSPVPSAATSSWARPYVKSQKPAATLTQEMEENDEQQRTTITMRDAMFVIESDRGHGGGRGAARGWI